jgi:hypothetical protein
VFTLSDSPRAKSVAPDCTGSEIWLGGVGDPGTSMRVGYLVGVGALTLIRAGWTASFMRAADRERMWCCDR